MGYLNKEELNIKEIFLTPKRLKDLVDLIDKGTISFKQAKEIFDKVLAEQKEVKEFVREDNAQLSDRNELEKIIEEIINNSPNQVEQYHNGKTNLFDYFVGQVMKNTKGKANPVLTKEILKEKLDN